MSKQDDPNPDNHAVETGPGWRPLGNSPSRISDPRLRHEFARAMIWTATVGAVVLAVTIARPLLVIFGGMVFAAMIDGGARLLGRILPIARGWRVAIVLILTVLFFAWLGYFAGSTVSQQAAQFPSVIETQLNRLVDWAQTQGFDISQAQLSKYAGGITSGIGTVTRALTGVVGAITTVILIAIIGVYVALEPQLYERGIAWILPQGQREEFYKTASDMAYTLRRLMAGRLVGMAVEALFTYILLVMIGVPMAALLAILTGLFAFIPNLGAIISGALMALVGFSVGVDTGLYTIGVYLLVQNFDGYVVIPMIAKKTVDLAPALVLAMQLIMGLLFGVLGLFLADPAVAMLKVALERRAERNQSEDEARIAANHGA
ncbi:MAG: AI-2E family transporter [Sphingomonadaceae bacterium]